MINRPRRLRYNCHIRELSRETRISEQSLIYPLFIREGKNIKDPISTLAGQYHLSPDRASEEVESAMQYGVRKFLLFGVPDEKDEIGSSGYAENGVVQQALRELKKRFGEDVFIVTDVCMCDYTSHGHCGIIDGQYVDNDKTLEYLAKIAVSQASAGSDMVAPSDMMADSSAPKKATCSATGMCSITRVGSTFCGSSESRPEVPGMTISAAMTTNMGTKAKPMYSRPPATGPRRAVVALLDDITRWNTSCCGMEPSIMVMAAAKKKVHSLAPPVGKKLNLPSRAA